MCMCMLVFEREERERGERGVKGARDLVKGVLAIGTWFSEDNFSSFEG